MKQFLAKYKKALLIGLPILTAGTIGTIFAVILFSTPTFEWKFSTPEEQGMNPALIEDMLNYAESNGDTYSIIIIRNGYIVAERYLNGHELNDRIDVWSVTKSFTSALVGIAVDRGYISVDDYILDFFPDLTINNPSPEKDNMTIRHFLTMTTGLQQTIDHFDTNISNVLGMPMLYPPGDQVLYHNGAPHTLQHILQKETGQSAYDFAIQNFFNPLAMKNYHWPTDTYGVPQGGFGLELRARDMAKLGMLYLNNGTIQGKRILSSDWIQTSISPNMDLASVDEYGYFWWLGEEYYHAYGNRDQVIAVSPSNNLVAVFQSNNIFDHSFVMMQNYVLPSIIS
jgi:CubicO group peptidase (beta-lactamase class C family)